MGKIGDKKIDNVSEGSKCCGDDTESKGVGVSGIVLGQDSWNGEKGSFHVTDLSLLSYYDKWGVSVVLRQAWCSHINFPFIFKIPKDTA